MWQALKSKLAGIRSSIREADSLAAALNASQAEIPPGEINLINETWKEAKATQQDLHLFSLKTPILQADLASRATDVKDREDYKTKIENRRWLSEQLQELNAAIAYPETGKPSALFAIPSKDGKGRYVLEDKETKKRSSVIKGLEDLLPMKFVTNPPRRESFAELHKKKKDFLQEERDGMAR